MAPLPCYGPLAMLWPLAMYKSVMAPCHVQVVFFPYQQGLNSNRQSIGNRSTEVKTFP